MVVKSAALHCFFQTISAEHNWAVMLGGAAEPTPLNQWCMIGLGSRQTAILQGEMFSLNGNPEVIGQRKRLFETLEGLRKQARHWPSQSGLPFAGGLFCALGYGFHRWCDAHWETALPGSVDWPDAIICEFEDWLLVHLESAQLHVFCDSLEREAWYYQQWIKAQAKQDAPLEPTCPAPEDYKNAFSASLGPQAFESAVERLKEDIGNGEIYQANLSLRLQKTVKVNPCQLFERLCQRNPSPFAGFFKWPGGVIVSNSPERLVQVDSAGFAQTRPIAGTRGRGKTQEEDVRVGQTLLENEKERAEHLMLVDLARNDLGRLCEPGSVQVEDLLFLERYSHVTHLVSNVQGKLQTGVTPWAVLASLFPGGTITGCPKIRCIEILNAVEPVSRGFYTGSFGYIDAATGALDFNILIRSVFLQSVALQPTASTLVYNAAVHVGAGIVHDAVGAHEARECARKAAAILNELYTLEVQPIGKSAL
jgi:para-aminobenzoate synthetase component 1